MKFIICIFLAAAMAGCMSEEPNAREETPELGMIFRLIDCNQFGSTRTYQGNSAPQEYPPGWTEDATLSGVDIDIYDCAQVGIDELETGRTSVFVSYTTDGSPPDGCEDFTDFVFLPRLIYGIWTTNTTLSSVLHDRYHIPGGTIDLTKEINGMRKTWTWTEDGQESHLQFTQLAEPDHATTAAINYFWDTGTSLGYTRWALNTVYNDLNMVPATGEVHSHTTDAETADPVWYGIANVSERTVNAPLKIYEDYTCGSG